MKSGTLSTLASAAAILSLALCAPARSQEPQPSSQSIVDAARNAREQKSNSANAAKVVTTDDLVPSPPPAASVQSETDAAGGTAAKPGSNVVAAALPPEGPDCNNPENDRIQAELQDAQGQLDQLQRDLAYDPKVISDGDVDMKNFKEGSSGLAFGSPPLSQSTPQAPDRITEVILKEKVASLKRASQLACDSPKNAKVQAKLDEAEKQLKILQRQFDLDNNAYYSKTDYASDTAGKANLDAEQQQIDSLKADIEQLKSELPPPESEQSAQQ
jgi:hypothetical protein